MSTVSKNIKFLRKKERLTQEQLAEKIGIKRSLLGAYEEGRADPRLNNLLAVSKIFNVSVDNLISCDISENPDCLNATSVENKDSGLKVLAITIDKQDNENIELVPYKASAGYLNGYADPEYVGTLPRFQLPFLPNSGTYRAFEIVGDSMLPLPSETVLIGQYVERFDDIKNGATYVLLTKKEGVVYKRIFNQIANNNRLLLVSDNKLYPPYQVEAEDVLEIWEARSYISQSFPDPMPGSSNAVSGPATNGHEITLEKLASIVLDLQNEMLNLKSSIKKQ